MATQTPSVMSALLGWINDHINQAFKWTRATPLRHSGVDYNVSYGTPLATPDAGVILHSTNEAWGGQVDELVNVGGQDYVLSWLHLSDVSIVHPGQQVQPGQLIGRSGSPPLTGPNAYKYGDGPHLHFEVTHGDKAPYIDYSPRRPTTDNYPVNPVPWLENGGIGLNALPGDIPGISGVVDAINNLSKSFQGVATFSNDWLAKPWRIVKLVMGLGIIGLTLWAALNIKSVQIATNVVEGVSGAGNPVNRFARAGGTARGLGARPPQVLAPRPQTTTAPQSTQTAAPRAEVPTRANTQANVDLINKLGKQVGKSKKFGNYPQQRT